MATWKDIDPYVNGCPKQHVLGLAPKEPEQSRLYAMAKYIVLNKVLRTTLNTMLDKFYNRRDVSVLQEVANARHEITKLTIEFKLGQRNDIEWLIAHTGKAITNLYAYLKEKDLIAIKYRAAQNNLQGGCDIVLENNLGINLVWLNYQMESPKPTDIHKYVLPMNVTGRVFELTTKVVPSRLLQYYPMSETFLTTSYDGRGLEVLGKLADEHIVYPKPSPSNCKNCKGCNHEIFLHS